MLFLHTNSVVPQCRLHVLFCRLITNIRTAAIGTKLQDLFAISLVKSRTRAPRLNSGESMEIL